MARFIASWTSRSIVANLLILFSGWFDPGTGLEELQPLQQDRQPDPATDTQPVRKNPLRVRLFAKNPHCTYCGCEVSKQTSNLDHIWPKSRGGANCRSNLVLSCYDCNNDKGNSTLEEWWDQLRNRLVALQALHCKDISQDVSRKREYLRRVLAKVETMIDGMAGCTKQVLSQLGLPELKQVPTVQDTGYAKRKPGQLVKNQDFVVSQFRLAILDGTTGKVMFSDTNVGNMTEYLLTEGAKPDNPIRFVRYQEMFNPNWNLPDWRAHKLQLHDEYIASKANPSPDASASDSSDAIAVPDAVEAEPCPT